MDTSQYHSNGLGNNSPYSSLPGISPHQLQQNSNLPPHTLPPLQQGPQHATMQSMYSSAPHTPRTPATPNTPGSANAMGGRFPNMTQSQNYQMMSTNNYQQPSQPYRSSSSMMPNSSTAMSHTPIAPAPMHNNRVPQPLRPMPAHGLQHMPGSMGSPYGQNNMLSQLEMEPPTHVVGSQGRRGILPSAPGRPAVSATGTGKNAMIPAKDADGKFPCPHCTKTYLHAKHLKRHLLRHTGDRPYMCVLCRDTFSRSDILKRHFQKCSIRRGNPSGATHLSHAQAHLKKSHPGPHKSTNSMSNENDLMGVNGMGGLSNDPAMHPFGVIPDGSMPDAGSNLTDEQAEQLSRNNSIKRLSTGGGRDGRSMAGSVPGGSSRNSFDQSYAGAIASTMPSGMNPSLAFNMPHGQNGHSYSQGYDYSSHGNSANVHPQSSATQDWSQMFQPSAPEGFMSQYNPVTNSNIPIKTEYIKPEPSLNNSSNGLFTGIYPGTNTTMTATSLPSWNFQNDPLEEISSRLLYLCFSNNQIVISKRSNDLRMYLSANNIKHFLENYTNFQGHFPVIHMPTFRIGEAFDGLLLGMICIGAVYSDRMTSTEVREMMELAKVVIERNSRVFSIISREQNVSLGNGTIGQNAPFGNEKIGSSKSELEEITAIFMMQVLFTWHGTPLQREKARQEFPLVAEIARRSELTRPMSTSQFSVLHQPNVKVENFNAASFDWNAWVEQEKRSRLMFTIFLVDASMVVYFNIPPRFERDEIRLPLPADDAAWDATSSVECADALGLNGPVAAQSRNPEGSRRPKQPEMHTALKALMHNVWDLQPGTTNVYSKFILVHALHIQLWIAQRQISLQELGQPTPLAYLSSGTSTPISQNDWVRGIDTTRSGSQSANTSGRVTPVEANGQSSQLLMTISNAFEKWKKVWDEDMATQYPPSSTHYRRFGFCRDSVAFYYLSRLLTQNKGMDWQMAPDQRFSRVIQMLKTVKGYVVTDSAKRGEALGSVSDVDSNYAVSDLTLDMAQLFKPINKQIDSPVQGVHMSISNGMV